jgi:hypothetical protein
MVDAGRKGVEAVVKLSVVVPYLQVCDLNLTARQMLIASPLREAAQSDSYD